MARASFNCIGLKSGDEMWGRRLSCPAHARNIENDMTSRFNAALDQAIFLPLTTNFRAHLKKDATACEQLVKNKGGGDMGDLPEEAVIAAARAIFEHTMLAGIDPTTKMREWLTEAGDYREIARTALLAALPHLTPE